MGAFASRPSGDGADGTVANNPTKIGFGPVTVLPIRTDADKPPGNVEDPDAARSAEAGAANDGGSPNAGPDDMGDTVRVQREEEARCEAVHQALNDEDMQALQNVYDYARPHRPSVLISRILVHRSSIRFERLDIAHPWTSADAITIMAAFAMDAERPTVATIMLTTITDPLLPTADSAWPPPRSPTMPGTTPILPTPVNLTAQAPHAMQEAAAVNVGAGMNMRVRLHITMDKAIAIAADSIRFTLVVRELLAPEGERESQVFITEGTLKWDIVGDVTRIAVRRVRQSVKIHDVVFCLQEIYGAFAAPPSTRPSVSRPFPQPAPPHPQPSAPPTGSSSGAPSSRILSSSPSGSSSPAPAPATPPAPNPAIQRPPPSPALRPSTSASQNLASLDCPICLSEQRCVIVLPCRHLCLCRECAEAVMMQGRGGPGVGKPTCPICRADVDSFLHIRLPPSSTSETTAVDLISIRATTPPTIAPNNDHSQSPASIYPSLRGSAHLRSHQSLNVVAPEPDELDGLPALLPDVESVILVDTTHLTGTDHREDIERGVERPWA
ncbi:uncharacterized protein EV422DRAFT_387300 [Fimicolochytrium jonesii]|uniref:uncharacterized protein n=1 Tax=Fimicolochytrium jonesii TaxID=1396493 RepID=UPI0022FDB220|nr:uncharacterized protein EV422DRAFT_387300 [Fimicolochytrium jonesii]KAI8822984.1 hypothetical protein EV422DRAFT_387300 [Fimicolochytrium jonesii]